MPVGLNGVAELHHWPYERRSAHPLDKILTQYTFTDALALVRHHLWQHAHFSLSRVESDLVQIPCSLSNCLTETLCYAT
jgi:hypothetical protein